MMVGVPERIEWTFGRLAVVYQAAGAPDRILDPLIANLERAGYDHVEEFVEGETARLLAVACRPHRQAPRRRPCRDEGSPTSRVALK